MHKLILAGLCSALMASSALAADLYVPAPEEAILASTGDWTGFYAGVSAGYGVSRALHSGSPTDYSDLQGWIGGVQAGYNHDLGGVVLGIEGDLSLSAINEGPDTDHFGENDGIHGIATLRGRLGVTFESVLLYGTAGLAAARIDEDGSSDTLTGWVAGAGAEIMVTDTVSLKAEYLYHNFGNTFLPGYGDDFDITAQTFKVGANFHF
jgi:outer membrane immunogenic protein